MVSSLSGNNSWQVVHTHVPLLPSIKLFFCYRSSQGVAVLCGWEGNCRCGTTLDMHHRLTGITTYRLDGLGREMSSWAPHLCSRGTWCPVPFFNVL